MRSRISLRAAGTQQASAAELSFHVDQVVTSCMRTGDELHLARTGCGGVGLSVIRDGALVVAAGAVTAVPLGRTVCARITVVAGASGESPLDERDWPFSRQRRPVTVSVNGSSSILHGGRRMIDDYQIVVVSGFAPGIPGTDECAAINDRRQCPDAAAQYSAMLMADRRALSITGW
jgi:hypothetical protein